MNERINNLRLDAGISTLHDAPYLVAINKSGEIIDPIIGLEKFAELIVKDVRWVMQTAADDFILDKNYDAVKGVGRCMRRVKQHFGVEE